MTEKKPGAKRGRPPAEVPRDITVSLRLTRPEYAALQRAAASIGVSATTWLQKVAVRLLKRWR